MFTVLSSLDRTPLITYLTLCSPNARGPYVQVPHDGIVTVQRVNDDGRVRRQRNAHHVPISDSVSRSSDTACDTVGNARITDNVSGTRHHAVFVPTPAYRVERRLMYDVLVPLLVWREKLATRGDCGVARGQHVAVVPLYRLDPNTRACVSFWAIIFSHAQSESKYVICADSGTDIFWKNCYGCD